MVAICGVLLQLTSHFVNSVNEIMQKRNKVTQLHIDIPVLHNIIIIENRTTDKGVLIRFWFTAKNDVSHMVSERASNHAKHDDKEVLHPWHAEVANLQNKVQNPSSRAYRLMQF